MAEESGDAERVGEGAHKEKLGGNGKEAEDALKQKAVEKEEEEEQDCKPHKQEADSCADVRSLSARVKGSHDSDG